MSVSSRPGVRRALRAYVIGRDSGSSTEAKRELAEASLRLEDRERSEAAKPAGSGEAGAPSPASGSPLASRFGVPIPTRLDFHRSASRWRDFIPGLRSGGA